MYMVAWIETMRKCRGDNLLQYKIWLFQLRRRSKNCLLKIALNKFGDRRTNWDKGSTFQGVETPSQSRFVGYYDIITNKLDGQMPPLRTLKLKEVIIHSIKGKLVILSSLSGLSKNLQQQYPLRNRKFGRFRLYDEHL